MPTEATNMQRIIDWLCALGYDKGHIQDGLERHVPGVGRADLFYKKDRVQFVLEAKKPGIGEEDALQQAIRYAGAIRAPGLICIATDYATYLHTWHCGFSCPLSDEEGAPIAWRTRHLLRADNFPLLKKEGTLRSRVKSLPELEKVFDAINNRAMKMGVSVGEKRVEEMGKLIFLKMLADNDTILDDGDWRWLRDRAASQIIGAVNTLLQNRIAAEHGIDISPLQLSDSLSKGEHVAAILELLDGISFRSEYYDCNSTLFQRFISSRARGQTNDLGQYFTPPHLIDLLYDLARYRPGMTVYDPCCGVGGILGRVFTRQEFAADARAAARRFGKEHLFGTENTPEVAVLARMNMIIMGDGHTNIQTCDALDGAENPFIGQNKIFDRVITNIPFAPAEPSIANRDYFRISWGGGAKANFIEHCVNCLAPDGRAVIIVPKGFLDERQSAEFRRRLLEKYDLEAVYQLFSGVFAPYTPAHSAILVINKAPRREAVRFLFVRNEDDMQNLAADGDSSRQRALHVSAERILQNTNCSWNGEAYRSRELRPGYVRLGDIADLIPDSETAVTPDEARDLPKVTTPNDIKEGIHLVPSRSTRLIHGQQGSFTQRVMAGALIIARIVNGKNMTLGSCEANQDGLITKEYHQLRLKDPAHMPHVLYAIRARAFQDVCYSAAGTGGQQRIHADKILAMQILAPTPQRIARARAAFQKIAAANAEISRQKEILEKLEREISQQDAS